MADLHVHAKTMIIGLPRTGTTSVCAALLNCDLQVAHTAYTQAAMTRADVVADTPVFCEFRELHQCFPSARFIYLQRDLASWLPSIHALLSKMSQRLAQRPDYFQPLLLRCFARTFDPWPQRVPNFSELENAYQQHQKLVENYFADSRNRLFAVNINKLNNETIQRQLCAFMQIDDDQFKLPVLNVGIINDWDNINHHNKVAANLAGAMRRRYFDYELLAF